MLAEHGAEFENQLKALLKIPSVSAQPDHDVRGRRIAAADDCRRTTRRRFGKVIAFMPPGDTAAPDEAADLFDECQFKGRALDLDPVKVLLGLAVDTDFHGLSLPN